MLTTRCYERYRYSGEGLSYANTLRRRYDLGSIKAELGLRRRDKMSDNKVIEPREGLPELVRL